jgi:hypothetical protein
MFTIDKLLELLFIKYNTNVDNKKLDLNFIYSCDGKYIIMMIMNIRIII